MSERLFFENLCDDVKILVFLHFDCCDILKFRLISPSVNELLVSTPYIWEFFMKKKFLVDRVHIPKDFFNNYFEFFIRCFKYGAVHSEYGICCNIFLPRGQVSTTHIDSTFGRSRPYHKFDFTVKFQTFPRLDQKEPKKIKFWTYDAILEDSKGARAWDLRSYSYGFKVYDVEQKDPMKRNFEWKIGFHFRDYFMSGKFPMYLFMRIIFLEDKETEIKKDYDSSSFEYIDSNKIDFRMKEPEVYDGTRHFTGSNDEGLIRLMSSLKEHFRHKEEKEEKKEKETDEK